MEHCHTAPAKADDHETRIYPSVEGCQAAASTERLSHGVRPDEFNRPDTGDPAVHLLCAVQSYQPAWALPSRESAKVAKSTKPAMSGPVAAVAALSVSFTPSLHSMHSARLAVHYQMMHGVLMPGILPHSSCAQHMHGYVRELHWRELERQVHNVKRPAAAMAAQSRAPCHHCNPCRARVLQCATR